MRKLILFPIILLFAVPGVYCQQPVKSTDLNFTFERRVINMPADWMGPGNPEYRITMDSIIKHGGKYAVCIQSTEKSEGFGVLSILIPGKYPGNTITFSAYLKTENVSQGGAALWMRIDPDVAFDNMQGREIKGTTDWGRYEISLKMDTIKTSATMLGLLLEGKGKVWLDDVKVTIDGKDIRDLEPIKPKEVPADSDHEFDNGSRLINLELAPRKILDLKVLGMVWGFIKYYHPAVAAGNLNWDYELFRILPAIMGCSGPDHRDSILCTWIRGLGEFSTIQADKQDSLKPTISPDLEWISNSGFSNSLTVLLLKIKNAKRTGLNYYVDLATGAGNPEFKNEKAFTAMQYPDAGFRLLALFRYWNIIQYYFPYRDLIGEDWKNVLEEFIPGFINAKSTLVYKLEVLTLIARVHDTHANIWNRDTVISAFRGRNFAAVETRFAENKAVVWDYYDNDKGKLTGLSRGDIIERINGIPVDSLIKGRLKYTPASNYPTQLRDIARHLLRTNDSVIDIVYLKEGKKHQSRIDAYPADKLNLYKSMQSSDTCFRMADNGIAYIFPGNIKSAYLPELWQKIQGSRGLIIDLRCYPSDFIVFSLGEYLMPASTAFAKFSEGSIYRPGQFTTGVPMKVGEYNPQSYKGKIIILVNEITQSQAEYTAMAFRAAPGALVIGSTTAGADGNVSPFDLPGGIHTMISGIGVFYPDGRGTQRTGIIPDIEVRPTIEGIRNNRDEVLEKAVSLINNDK